MTVGAHFHRTGFWWPGRAIVTLQAVLLLALARPIHGAPAASSVLAVAGSTQKVCQLTGDQDRQVGQPTTNQTQSRFGVVGTDLGSSFEHAGRTYFLFGDTVRAGGRAQPDEEGSRPGEGNDSIAVSDDLAPDDCLDLSFVSGPDGRFRSPRVPGVSLMGFEVPTSGFSDGQQMYVFFATDRSAQQQELGRSVLARSSDGGANFEFLYNVSTKVLLHTSSAVVENATVPGLPRADGKGVFIWGSGRYRKSDPTLAYLPLATAADRSTLRFFAGIDEQGAPRWSDDDSTSATLFPQGCVGELSTGWNPFLQKWLMLFNCENPRGIILRSSDAPWGPWSEPTVVFQPWDDGGYCNFIHASWEFRNCDNLHGSGRQNIWGGSYAPYQIHSLARGQEGETTIYFVMSTWNPYQVVLMRSTLRLAP